MATYYHGGSEIQADGLQTLFLMNPNYVGYSDTQQQANMLFLNSATGNALNTANITHAPPSKTQHFVGIPLSTANSDGPGHECIHQQHEIQALHGVLPRFHYNLWGSAHQAATGSHPHIPTAVALSDSGGTTDVETQLGFNRPAVSPTQQGLSLSLSPQRPVYRSFPTGLDVPVQTPVAVISPRGGEGSSSVSNGISGLQSAILGSKYLQAAQQLLDEVVNVGKRIKGCDLVEGNKEGPKANRDSVAGSGGSSGGSSGGKSSTKGGAELTTSERQEIQMKKGKLVSMLDEVDHRYRQYHYQMQIVVTSFEQATGLGSAKSYTALALQTISKQFRCLKDAISAQIKDTSKNLGENDCIGGKVEVSKLKFVDHQIRQQRALQNLGMMQHNAWRPQRGLPERAVSVLRAWLFEHFLHPYPKDSDKHMLAKQTGLTRSQVSNWFINARVRLWKPMVEEMYLEEFKGEEQTGSGENKSRSKSSKDSDLKSTAQLSISTAPPDQINALKSKQGNPLNRNASPSTTSPTGASLQAQAGFALMRPSNMEGNPKNSPKKPRNEMQNSPSSILSVDMDTKHGETIKGINDRFSRERQTDTGDQFGTYTIGELGRFTQEQLATGFQGNGVSLTLALPHCDNLSLSGTHHNFLSDQNIQLGSRLEIDYNGINNQQASQSNTAYENVNIQNRKRFAAQLFNDFVA